jgi:hypothetical protein
VRSRSDDKGQADQDRLTRSSGGSSGVDERSSKRMRD